VLSAATGEEALALCAAGQRPDLLLTDVVMPGISGRVLAERLGRAQPGLKVLFLSGYTDDEVLRHGVRTESLTFLQKPYTPAQLRAAVRAALGQRA
jgi:CheY-like chemotaxis protein